MLWLLDRPVSKRTVLPGAVPVKRVSGSVVLMSPTIQVAIQAVCPARVSVQGTWGLRWSWGCTSPPQHSPNTHFDVRFSQTVQRRMGI